MKRKVVAIISAVLMASTLVLVAPSVAGALSGGSQLPPGAPAKLRDGNVSIALVRENAQGDFYEQFALGAEKMASLLNVHLLYYDANGNDALMATQFKEAMARHPNAIIVDHGMAPTMDGLINQAVAQGIRVVLFDIVSSNKKTVQVQQNDVELGYMIATKMVDDLHHKGQVAYVYTPGYTALDRRNQAWVAVKKTNPGIIQVAQYGTPSLDEVETTESGTKTVLTAHPDLNAILAPYDSFAAGATLAVEADHLQGQVKVYSSDIGTPDIQMMVAKGSPWVASACTDPNNDGAVLVRTATLAALGIKVPQYPQFINIPPTLVTQSFLRANHLTTLAGLVQKLPALNSLGIATASWMPKISL
jgi:simple sugar transport system substrate-binding protein